MESSPVRHRLLLVSAALLFSTGGAAFKAITLNAWQVAGFRSAIAALVLLIALPEARRGWSWRIVPVAMAYAATLVTFVVANKLTTSANAIFLQSTAPLYLLLLGPLVLREPIRRADVLYMLGVLGGITLFFIGTESAVATAPDPQRGNAIALVSGVVYALMLAGLRWLARDPRNSTGLAASVLGNIFAFACTMPMALPVASVTGTDVAVLVYLGVVQIGLAYILLTRGLRHVPAVEATTVLMIEPALNPVWSWLLHGERPGALSLTGGVLILLASVVNTWRRARVTSDSGLRVNSTA
jgi:drug/metabolite transporter, DME family